MSGTETINENENGNENSAMAWDDEIDFNELYLHYVRDIEEKRTSESMLMQQLQEIRNAIHFEYCYSKDIPTAGVNRNCDQAICEWEKNPGKVTIERSYKVLWNKGPVLVMGDSTSYGG